MSEIFSEERFPRKPEIPIHKIRYAAIYERRQHEGIAPVICRDSLGEKAIIGAAEISPEADCSIHEIEGLADVEHGHGIAGVGGLSAVGMKHVVAHDVLHRAVFRMVPAITAHCHQENTLLCVAETVGGGDSLPRRCVIVVDSRAERPVVGQYRRVVDGVKGCGRPPYAPAKGQRHPRREGESCGKRRGDEKLRAVAQSAGKEIGVEIDGHV